MQSSLSTREKAKVVVQAIELGDSRGKLLVANISVITGMPRTHVEHKIKQLANGV